MNGYQIATLVFVGMVVLVLFLDYRERKTFNDFIRAKSKCGCKDHPEDAPAPNTIDTPVTQSLL